MMISDSQSGISAVELLVTLFVAFIFIMTGYQLYSVIMIDGSEAQRTSELNTQATFQLKKKANSLEAASIPNCSATPQGAPIVSNFSDDGIATVVTVSCPKSTLTNIVRITSESTFKDTKVSHAIFKKI